MTQNNGLDLSNYLEANIESSKRTRVVLLALVMASVLALSGFLNSFKYSWASQRLAQIVNPDSSYTHKFLKTIPEKQKKESQNQKQITTQSDRDTTRNHSSADSLLTDKYRSLYAAFIEAYVENTFTIRVPFFGISFDVNDLGLIGGLGFTVILFLLRYSLARELDNLTLSFATLQDEKENLKTFYYLLSMRQVLTIPPREGKENVKRMNFWPKTLFVFPWLVQTLVTLYDAYTMDIGFKISLGHSIINYTINVTFAVLISVMTLSCFNVLKKIDSVWTENFLKISGR